MFDLIRGLIGPLTQPIDWERKRLADIEKARHDMAMDQLEWATGRDRLDIAINGFPDSDLSHPTHFNQSLDPSDLANYNKIVPRKESGDGRG